jgi:hypothetical protein
MDDLIEKQFHNKPNRAAFLNRRVVEDFQRIVAEKNQPKYLSQENHER